VQGLVARLGARFAIRAGKTREDCRCCAAPAPAPGRGGAHRLHLSSTGRPKGVVVRHQALLWKLEVLSRLLDSLWKTLSSSLATHIHIRHLGQPTQSDVRFAASIVAQVSAAALTNNGAGAVILAAVPTLLRTLCADTTLDAPCVRSILTGGEPFWVVLADKLAALLPRANLFDLFGLTETGSCDFARGPRTSLPRRHDWSSDKRRRVPHSGGAGTWSAPGGRRAADPHAVCHGGYLDDPAQSAGAFADGYFRTGDSRRFAAMATFSSLVAQRRRLAWRNKIVPLEIENLFAQHESVWPRSPSRTGPRLGESLHLMIIAP